MGEAGNEPGATRRAISELRRISGLTWQQLGQLLGVSRRSVHYWASGKPLNAGNQKRLMRVLDIVRTAYRGSARGTRAALLDAGEGTTPLDMLTMTHESFRKSPYTTADEMWEALSPTRDLVPPPCKLMYRGQADAEWELLPTVLRSPVVETFRKVDVPERRRCWASRHG